MSIEYELISATDVEFDLDVIMITYQHGRYIAQAIESVLMQKTRYKFHIIILDDGSTDGAKEIILRYQRKYPQIITTAIAKSNTHHLFRRGLEVKLSHANYVAYCEGDDYWTDVYKLEKQIGFLERHHEFIAVTGNVIKVDENGEIQHTDYDLYPFRESHIYTKQNVRMSEMVSHLSAICHRNFKRDWNESACNAFFDCKMNEDMKLSAVLAMNGQIYYSHDVFGNHRRVMKGTSWTAQMKSMGDQEKLKLFQSMWEDLERYLNDSFTEGITIENLRNFGDKWKENREIDASYRTMLSAQKYIVTLYDLWMLTKKGEKTISAIIHDMEIKTVAIYGMSTLGVRLFHELKNSGVEVLYGRDRNTAINIPELKIYPCKPDVCINPDAIIVTSVTGFDEIKQSLIEEGFRKIISMDELLYRIIPEDLFLFQ